MANKTPVTILQEFMVRRHDTPTYNLIVNEIGTHEPLFKYEVTGLGKLAIGSGKSKKEAKHEAARLLIHMLKDDKGNVELVKNPILKEVDDCFSPYDNTIKDNAVGDLQMFCNEYNLMNPKYDLILDIGPPHSKLFTIKCTVSSFEFEATARTKKQAKHRCSAGMLQKLKLCHSDFIDPSDQIGPVDNQNIVCDLAKRTIIFGHPINDLSNIFTSSYFPESPTFKNIRNDYTNIRDASSKLDLLKTVCEELNYELDITQLPSEQNERILVNIFLVSKPGWSFIGIGQDYDDALNSAVGEVFEFLVDMIPL